MWVAVSVVVCSLVAPVSVLAEGQASPPPARPTTYESPSTLAPSVSETWLTAEVEGDGQLSTTSGGNPVFGIVGTRVNFEPISHYQPRLGLGFQFPLDGKANDQADWG